MAIEQNIKTILGEQIVTILSLQDQLEEANKRIAELEKNDEDKQ